MRRNPGICLIVLLVVSTSSVTKTATAHEVATGYVVKPISLTGSNAAILLDHLAYDRTNGTIWVPGSNTGNVYVIKDSGGMSVVSGFTTGEVEVEGTEAKLGPTAIALHNNIAYIGNRSDSTLSVVDARTLKRENRVDVKHHPDVPDSGPHAVAYVDATNEVWLTTGPGKSIEIFDASDPKHPKWKGRISLEAGSEGYAVDNQRGRFYTNLDGLGRTIAIEVRSHNIIADWNVESHDTQGLALDTRRGFIFVACNDHVVSLDANHQDKILDSVGTGAGLDDIDFSLEDNILYAAASLTATLAIVKVDDAGKFHVQDLVMTAKGSRGVIAGKKGEAYLIDPAKGQILQATRIEKPFLAR